MKRKPHREICSLCNEVSRIGFHVPDKVWALTVHASQIEDIICLRCFTRLADERGVRWDKHIKFFPISQITAYETLGISAERKLLAVNIVIKLINNMNEKEKVELQNKMFPRR